MAVEVCMLLYLFFLLPFVTTSSSGTLVGFSYDARRNNANSSPMEIISFLKENKVSPPQIRVFVSDHRSLHTLSTTGVLVDLHLNEFHIENPTEAKAFAISWVEKHFPFLNVMSVIVSPSSISELVAQKQLSLLLATLKAIHSALEYYDIHRKVKVSVRLPFANLVGLETEHAKDMLGIMDFISKYKSFVVLETKIDGELSMGNRFVGMMTESALAAAKILDHRNVQMVLNVKSSVVPSATEAAEFNEKMMESIKSHVHMRDRIYGVYAEISAFGRSEQKELSREEEQILHSFRRELNSLPVSTTKITLHDDVSHTPMIVTVPSTNPVVITPANPVNAPVATVPSTTPVSATPITVPPIVPLTPPAAPIGNLVPPPTPVQMASPTNPVTTSPVPPAGGIPIAPPVATPVTNPVSPPAVPTPSTGSGQAWCVAKTGAAETALQSALDYACGIGGADCSAIQATGSCYSPITLQSHASYAFNSYYHKNPAPTSCDFKGAATLVNTNPSTGSCVFPSSTAGAVTTPATPTTPASPTTTPATPTTPASPTITPAIPTPSSSFPTPSMPDSPTTPSFGFSPPGLSPPGLNSTDSVAADLQPILLSVVLASFVVTGRLLMGIGFQV